MAFDFSQGQIVKGFEFKAGQQTTPTPVKNAGYYSQKVPVGTKTLELAGKAADVVNSIYDKYKNLPGLKQAGQVVGGAVGAMGALEGATVGAIGTPIANLITGKPLFQNLGKNVVETAKSTAGFGYETGKEGLPAATLGLYGKAVQIPLAVAQEVGGIKNVKEGLETGNTEQALTGGFQLATGLVALRGSLKSDGLLFSKGTKSVINRSKAAIIETYPELKPIVQPLQSIKPVAEKILQNKTYQYARETLNPTTSQVKNERQWFKDSPKFLADEGVMSLIDREGNKLNTQRAQEALGTKYQAEASAFKRIIADVPKYEDLNVWRDAVINKMKKDPTFKASGGNLQKSIDYVNNEFDALEQNYQSDLIRHEGKSLLPLSTIDEIKSGRWDKAFGNKALTEPDAVTKNVDFLMGKEGQAIVEGALDDVNTKGMNKRLGDFASALKLLQNRDGATVKGGRLGKYVGMMIGAIPGSSIVESIAGAITGGKLAEILQDPRIPANIAQKVLESVKKMPEGQSLLDQANQIIEQNAAARTTRKLLTAPKTIELPSMNESTRQAQVQASGAIPQGEIQPKPMSFEPTQQQKIAENIKRTQEWLAKNQKGEAAVLPRIVSPKKTFNSALDALRDPEIRARNEAIQKQMNKKVTKTSNNLYHTTSAENLQSIQKNGLTTGNKARFEGVSSPTNISFSANEKGAQYYGKSGDVMIRTKASFKPKDLSYDLLAGGEGYYTTKTNIPPEMLEIKQGKKWIDLKDYKKSL